jgi:hypothetical protein
MSDKEKIVGLTESGKEDLALAILLWKDFKADGRFDLDITLQAMKMADYLGVRDQYDSLLSKIPPMKIEPR